MSGRIGHPDGTGTSRSSSCLAQKASRNSFLSRRQSVAQVSPGWERRKAIPQSPGRSLGRGRGQPGAQAIGNESLGTVSRPGGLGPNRKGKCCVWLHNEYITCSFVSFLRRGSTPTGQTAWVSCEFSGDVLILREGKCVILGTHCLVFLSFPFPFVWYPGYQAGSQNTPLLLSRHYLRIHKSSLGFTPASVTGSPRQPCLALLPASPRLSVLSPRGFVFLCEHPFWCASWEDWAPLRPLGPRGSVPKGRGPAEPFKVTGQRPYGPCDPT